MSGRRRIQGRGEVLTAASFNTVNTFDAPNAVAPRPFSAAAKDGKLMLRLPPHSVTVVRLDLISARPH